MRTILTLTIFCIAMVLSTAQAKAAPIAIVDVSAPAINCIFDQDCTITVTDTSDHFTLNGTSGDAFLQSRTFPPGEAGTVAEGLYGYEYRIDLRNLMGILHIPCITSFSIDFDPLVSLDYDGNGDLDDVFVVTQGGLGSVAPAVADKVGDTITFQFDPPVCAGGSPGTGDSTFFFGLISTLPPGEVVAQVRDTSEIDYDLNARAPSGAIDDKPLDHFKCYAVTPGEPINASVFLEDQFGATEAVVRQVFRFCNPVEKRLDNSKASIQNEDAHLMFYLINTYTPPPPRPVIVGNQFGNEQRLEVLRPLFLAMPTRKLTPLHPAPKGLDHFECYRVEGQSVDTVVTLEDQFLSESQVKVSEPLVLCNPVQKTHNDRVTPIQNPDDHLVCYRSEGMRFEKIVKTYNQFGPKYLTIGSSDLLCVPSQKFSEPKPLDHFKCYPTEGTEPIGASVFLKDQFGEGEARLQESVRFCNPVEKSLVNADGNQEVTPIQNPDHHLAFYRLETDDQSQTRPVQVSNQFGEEQMLKVSESLYLAVPTQKLEPEFHSPPQDLDHFQCYRAEGEPLEATVRLTDQFVDEPEVKVLEPFALCNPVEKEHDNVVANIQHPDDHLTCYQIQETEFVETEVQVSNQFGEQQGFKMQPADLLCVPSQKTIIEQRPHITSIGHVSVHEIDGGNVPIGDPGSGLANYTGYERPFGGWIPIKGEIPAGVDEFRVVYRQISDSRPVDPADANGIPIVPSVDWRPRDWNAATMNCSARTLYASDGDGWFDAAEFRRRAESDGIREACEDELAFTVWNSNGSGLDTEGHYVIWLQWRTGADPIQEESFDHHVQFDNTPPNPDDGTLALEIPGNACASYDGSDPEDMPIMVLGHIDDPHFWRYRLRVFGGNPPDHKDYSYINYDATVPGAAHVGPTGTGPGNVELHQVDVGDLPSDSVVDCCYGIRLRAWDRTIVGGFDPGTNGLPWHLGQWDDTEITFAYDAP